MPACRHPYIDFVADTIGRPAARSDPYQTPTAPGSSGSHSPGQPDVRVRGGAELFTAAHSAGHVAQVGRCSASRTALWSRSSSPCFPAAAGRVRDLHPPAPVGGAGAGSSVCLGCISPQVLSRFRPLAGLDARNAARRQAFDSSWAQNYRRVLGTSPSGLIMDIETEGQIVRGGRVSESTHSRCLSRSAILLRAQHAGLDARGGPDDLRDFVDRLLVSRRGRSPVRRRVGQTLLSRSCCGPWCGPRSPGCRRCRPRRHVVVQMLVGAATQRGERLVASNREQPGGHLRLGLEALGLPPHIVGATSLTDGSRSGER